MTKSWGKAIVAMVATVAFTVSASAQDLGVGGVGGQIAAAPASTPAAFVISQTIGLGTLDVSTLTGGLVQNIDAPKAAAAGGGATQTAPVTDGAESDAEAAETETTALIEASIETIGQTTAIETNIETDIATNDPVVSDDVGSNDDSSNNGVGGGVGGGKENNRGVGGGVGGGKENNRGNN